MTFNRLRWVSRLRATWAAWRDYGTAPRRERRPVWHPVNGRQVRWRGEQSVTRNQILAIVAAHPGIPGAEIKAQLDVTTGGILLPILVREGLIIHTTPRPYRYYPATADGMPS